MDNKLAEAYGSVLYQPTTSKMPPPGPRWHHGIRTFEECGQTKHIVYMYLFVVPDGNPQDSNRIAEVIEEHDNMMNLLEIINYKL